MSMYFAVNKANMPTTAEAVLNGMEKVEDAVRWYALVDLAFVFEDRSRKKSFEQLAPVLLYHRHPLDKLAEASPALIALATDSQSRSSQVCRLINQCSGIPMLSFVGSHETAMGIRDALAPCLYPNCGDDQHLLLRFADTRISCTLPQALSAGNWLRLTEPLTHWLHVGRTGELGSLMIPPEKEISPEDEEMCLTRDEFEALLEFGQADSVINALYEHHPELMPHENKAALFSQMQSVCAFSCKHNITGFPDLVALALASLLTEQHILENERLRAYLETQQRSEGSLGRKLLEFMD
jgi:hypothetical protein